MGLNFFSDAGSLFSMNALKDSWNNFKSKNQVSSSQLKFKELADYESVPDNEQLQKLSVSAIQVAAEGTSFRKAVDRADRNADFQRTDRSLGRNRYIGWRTAPRTFYRTISRCLF